MCTYVCLCVCALCNVRTYAHADSVFITVCTNMKTMLCVHACGYVWMTVLEFLRMYVIIQFLSFASAVHLIQPFCVLQLLVPNGANFAIDLW